MGCGPNVYCVLRIAGSNRQCSVFQKADTGSQPQIGHGNKPGPRRIPSHKGYDETRSKKVVPMFSYMVQVSYTPEALAALIANPQDRAEVVRKPIEKLGGKVGGAWLSFGDYDLVTIIEMPDSISAAAFALAIAAGGSLKAVKTTPLLGLAEGLSALKKAGGSGYKPIATGKR